ncbi:MAG: S8 family serine peptidase [Anaerolineae bacterium]|nr:S8 family serine peptidase [Anaerolineae bacterium]NUQ05553.1 S8 family serine peptidase [Anaerolineae bacterium]
MTLRFGTRTCSLLLFIALAALLSIMPAAAQDTDSGDTARSEVVTDGPYYYASGERVAVGVSTELVAIRLAPIAAVGAPADALARLESLAQVFPNLGDSAAATQPALLAGYDFYLVPLTGVATGDQALALVEALRGSSALAAWVNPVFTYDQAKLVLNDEIIAGFPAGTPQSVVDAYNAANGVEQVRVLSPDVYVLRVTAAAGVDALEMANRYETGGVASYGEPNFVQLLPPPDGRSRDAFGPGDARPPQPAAPGGSASADGIGPLFVPNDTYATWNWHINNTEQTPHASYVGLTSDADIDGYEAWDITQGSNTVIIAVLDDGMQLAHPDLNDKVVFPRDVAVSPNDDDPSPTDTAEQRAEDAHGTHAAGVAAAETNNAAGAMGVCINCKLMPIRIAYTSGGNWVATDANIATGIDWARTHGAHVLSNSWGGGSPSTSVTNAFKNAVMNGRGGLGSVVVIAAANTYQATVAYPGRLSNMLGGIVTVGASNWCDTIKQPDPPGDCSGEYWWGNNWGTEVVVTAPGHSITSPDLLGTDGYSGSGGPIPSDDYTQFNGTSSATPLTAGIAGLLVSQNPGWTADQVRDRLATSTDPIYAAGYDIASGWGRVNAQKALNNTTTNSGTPNDHLNSALVINTVPFTTTQAVSGTFMDRTDPLFACLPADEIGSNSVWFKFVPPYSMTATIDTIGSSYDTVLGVYNTALTSLACNDQFSGNQSQVLVALTGGTTYYIQVGDWTSTGGMYGTMGNSSLTLNITTVTPAPGPNLSGTVVFQGRPAAPNPLLSVPLHVIIKPTGGGAAVFDGMVASNNSGVFSLNVPAGNYNVWVKGAHTLANMSTINLAGNVAHNFGTLKEGDANDNNVVNISDFSLLASAFGSWVGQPGYNAAADFNGDSIVNISDFSILASNFAQSGAPAP